jgi:hypothetical protein
MEQSGSWRRDAELQWSAPGVIWGCVIKLKLIQSERAAFNLFERRFRATLKMRPRSQSRWGISFQLDFQLECRLRMLSRLDEVKRWRIRRENENRIRYNIPPYEIFMNSVSERMLGRTQLADDGSLRNRIICSYVTDVRRGRRLCPDNESCMRIVKKLI